MSKQYLKMADVFPFVVSFDSDGGIGAVVDSQGEYIAQAMENNYCSHMSNKDKNGYKNKVARYVAHSVASHDEIVEQNENMKLRINQLLSERNATGVAIEKALNGTLPEQHSMINRLRMIAGVAARNDDLVAEVERLREFERDAMRYRWLMQNTKFGIGRNGKDWDLQVDGSAPDAISEISAWIDNRMDWRMR